MEFCQTAKQFNFFMLKDFFTLRIFFTKRKFFRFARLFHVLIFTSVKISLFLLSIRTDNLISTPNTITFLPTLPSVNKNSKRESNPMS